HGRVSDREAADAVAIEHQPGCNREWRERRGVVQHRSIARANRSHDRDRDEERRREAEPRRLVLFDEKAIDEPPKRWTIGTAERIHFRNVLTVHPDGIEIRSERTGPVNR